MSVTLDVWRVPAAGVPAALLRVARTAAALRRTPGVTFAKVLGTGAGRTFTPRDATPRRWAVLAAWAGAPARSRAYRSWDRAAEEVWTARLDPLAARGRWSGRAPFADPAPRRHDGPVLALTRARIATPKLAAFWRAVPPVAADLHGSDGLLLALGVSELPVALQGTVSVWRDAAAMAAFAHGRAAHADAVRRTATEGWYAEELFARFALVETSGMVDGRAVP